MQLKVPEWIANARNQWEYRGQRRPPFADEPKPGQESVWDFPRPPALRSVTHRLEVKRGDLVIADTMRGFAVCETAHPPTYYFPRSDVVMEHLAPSPGSSFCEWKGRASYFDVEGGRLLSRAAWTYENPFVEFSPLAGAIAFMPGSLDCFVDGERVRPQPGGFYGGWITSRFSGPFKGEPGITG